MVFVLLSYIRRIPNHHIKPHKIPLIIQHFRKLKTPFKGIVKNLIGFDFFDFAFQFVYLFQLGNFCQTLLFFLGAISNSPWHGKVIKFPAKLGFAFDFGIVFGNFSSEIGFDVGNQPFHLPFLFLAFGIPIGIHGNPVTIDGPFAFFKRLLQIGIYGKAADQRIAAFDVDVNIRKGFQRSQT
jgi:hypothetical protein